MNIPITSDFSCLLCLSCIPPTLHILVTLLVLKVFGASTTHYNFLVVNALRQIDFHKTSHPSMLDSFFGCVLENICKCAVCQLLFLVFFLLIIYVVTCFSQTISIIIVYSTLQQFTVLGLRQNFNFSARLIKFTD